jgi:hypothetical protein
VKAKLIRFKKQYFYSSKPKNLTKVELMNVQEIEKARQDMIGFFMAPPKPNMRYKAAKALKKRLQRN